VFLPPAALFMETHAVIQLIAKVCGVLLIVCVGAVIVVINQVKTDMNNRRRDGQNESK